MGRGLGPRGRSRGWKRGLCPLRDLPHPCRRRCEHGRAQPPRPLRPQGRLACRVLLFAGDENSGVTWNDATLAEFLRDPQAFILGDKMAFPGIADPKEIMYLLAYLKKATE
jgi:hypothetical protein